MLLLFRAVSETDGTQLHLLNTDINSFDASCDDYPLFGDQIIDGKWNSVIQSCISDTFVVCVNEDVLFSLTLTAECEFHLIDYQNNEQINGGYSISDEIIKGSVSTIVFLIDGESIGEAVVAWPLEDDLCLIINGVVFKKKKNVKC